MSIVPSAIILVNNDLTAPVQEAIVRQLYIDLILTGDEFDTIVASDSDYVARVKRLNKRVMVIRSFYELQNRENIDIVVFMKEGLAAVEKCKYGPPGITVPIGQLHWTQIGIF